MACIIGITPSFDTAEKDYRIQAAYADAISAAGGVPLILPYLPDGDVPAVLGILAGLILSGGTDFDPALYGGQLRPQTSEIIAERDRFEITLAKAALPRRLPVLAICRGMQLVNVLRGGTIFDHTLDDRAEPSLDHRDGTSAAVFRHEVNVVPETRLAAICGTASFQANSLHHQAVDRIGTGLRAAAHAPDGVIEAYEDSEHPFLLGIQWHPEHLQHDATNRRILAAFVAACHGH